MGRKVARPEEEEEVLLGEGAVTKMVLRMWRLPALRGANDVWIVLISASLIFTASPVLHPGWKKNVKEVKAEFKEWLFYRTSCSYCMDLLRLT